MGTKVNVHVNLLATDRILVAGQARYVVLLPEYAESYAVAINAAASHKRDACHAQLLAVLQYIGENMNPRLPETSFRNEGDGIWAAKARCGLRAWGWFGDATRNGARQPVFAVSFVKMKKTRKADVEDLKTAKAHRANYET